jgi:predicted Zn-dependent protease
MKTGAPEQALKHAEEAYGEFPDRDPIEMGYARALLATGNYNEGAALLDGMRILPYEGASEGRVLFERTHTFRALQQMGAGDFDAALESLEKAQTWPEELGVGQPYNPDVRLQRYLQAVVNEERGSSGQAGELFEEVADYTRDHPERRGAGLYFGALAFRQSGQEEAARALLEEWQSGQPDNRMARWAAARFEGDSAQAQQIEQEILAEQMNTDSEFPLLIEAARTLDQIR